MGEFIYIPGETDNFLSPIIENIVIILCTYNVRSAKHLWDEAPIQLSTDYRFVKGTDITVLHY